MHREGISLTRSRITTPSFTSLENLELTPILRGLITESSLPLKVVEADFAVDSSGFTTSRFIRWFDHKYGVVRQQHEWVKVHLMCGVKTNVVTAVEIREKDASDTKLLPDLVNTTAKHFDMREVSADKGYSSVNNVNVIAEHGATPYIAFKSIHSGAAGGLWEKMFHYFAFNRQEFLGHYHKRSNVESDLQYDQGEVSRSCAEQDRHGNDERGAVQDPLSQYLLSDSRDV